MKISLMHPTGNPFAREAAIALAEVGLLKDIITALAYNPEKDFFWSYLKPIFPSIIAELNRRTWIAPEGSRIITYPWQEILRLALVKSGLSKKLGLGATGPIAWVYHSLDSYFAKNHLEGLSGVYAYEDGAATTFEKAKEKGIKCLYDLPILFYEMSRGIQQEEASLFPELASCLAATKEPQWKLERKEKELELADHIFVASSITKKSLLSARVNENKITVIPYGSPIDYFQPQFQPKEIFRALFVGRVGARKGVHYLLEAWQNLGLKNEGELMLVGVNEFPQGYLEKYTDICHYVPSVPHKSLAQYYNSASVFVFPSLVEGFGLVLLEAMACGIPVIATPNTAAPDIVTDGVDGFIVPIRDVSALQKKLEWCYHNPQELEIMGKAARIKAEKLTWSLYRQNLANKVLDLLKS